MFFHGAEIRPDGYGKCVPRSNHADHRNLAELPSSGCPRPRSDRTHNAASNVRQVKARHVHQIARC
jgi:hypothetical protein